jgi:hypothetical protein
MSRQNEPQLGSPLLGRIGNTPLVRLDGVVQGLEGIALLGNRCIAVGDIPLIAHCDLRENSATKPARTIRENSGKDDQQRDS